MLLKTELMKTQDPWQNKKKKDKKTLSDYWGLNKAN